LEDGLTFESLKLLPGTRLDIKSDQYSHLRGVSEFVGYHNQKTIIFSTPMLDGLPVACNIGSEIIVRLFVNHLNCVCAFRCEILHVSAVPFAFIYVSIPSEMEVGEVRKSVRANVELECKAFSIGGTKKPVECMIKNLSIDGAKMESYSMVAKVDEEIALEATLNVLDTDKVIKIKAIVRSVKQEKGYVYSYGLQLIEHNYGKKLLIHAYVLSHLIA